MPRKLPATSLKQINEINLTPMMDLTFILLITFIITFPLLEQGIFVKLPTASSSELPPDASRTVTVDRDGKVYLDNLPVGLDELAVSLGDIGRTNPDAMVMIRADEGLMYGKVVDVLKILRAANITKMALVTEADTR